MTEANNIVQAEVQVIAQATALGHVLEGFVVRQSRPEIGDTWRRSVCVDCGMLWDVRWSPEIGLAWAVAKLEQANRKRNDFDEDGEVPEPVSMNVRCLPPRCEESRTAGYGVWSFGLDLAA